MGDEPNIGLQRPPTCVSIRTRATVEGRIDAHVGGVNGQAINSHSTQGVPTIKDLTADNLTEVRDEALTPNPTLKSEKTQPRPRDRRGPDVKEGNGPEVKKTKGGEGERGTRAKGTIWPKTRTRKETKGTLEKRG